MSKIGDTQRMIQAIAAAEMYEKNKSNHFDHDEIQKGIHRQECINALATLQEYGIIELKQAHEAYLRIQWKFGGEGVYKCHI